MKKLIPMLLGLLLLLSGCSLERLMAMEIHESNPVSESTTALVFGGQEETGPVWVVTDAKTIAALRRSYQWTHDHMRCCLEGTVTDYIDFIEGSCLAPWDVSKHKLYQEDDVLAYNAAFRRELRVARDKAIPMQRTVAYADAPQRAQAVEAALPGCIVAIDSVRTAQGLEMHIISSEALSAEAMSTLRSIPGVTLP